jgi:hypothetical protein
MLGIRSLLALVLALSAIGCVSHAGPFVTNVRYDGNGSLIVDRCTADFNSFTNDISTGDCTEEIEPLTNAPPPPAAAPAPR